MWRQLAAETRLLIGFLTFRRHFLSLVLQHHLPHHITSHHITSEHELLVSLDDTSSLNTSMNETAG